MKPDKNDLLVYGANGYSAGLIIEELLKRNIKPVLAGRNEKAVKQVSQRLNLPYKIFDLSEIESVVQNIKEFHTVLNCAGPFKYTAKQLIEACLEAEANYLDITGEIPVLQTAFENDDAAKKSGIVILPSVGFDIIPTDCLAKRLSEKMPDAKHLMLGLLNKKGKISRGTWLTTIEFLGATGRIRREGKLIESQIGEYKISVKRNDFDFSGISIPWGDVFSSFCSTGIPNVEVYLGVPKFLYNAVWLVPVIQRIISLKILKNVISGFIKNNFTGPNKNQRDSTVTYIWGRVKNEKGETYDEAYKVMEGYNLTAVGAAESVIRVLHGEVGPGTKTPSLAFGSNFMDRFVIEKII